MSLSCKMYPLRSVQALLWVLLFQFLSPALYALTTDPEPNGYLATLCTIEGYQKVWIDLDGEPDGSDSVHFECPSCLFNLISSDIAGTTLQPLLAYNASKYSYFSTDQQHPLGQSLLNSLHIRAPPITV